MHATCIHVCLFTVSCSSVSDIACVCASMSVLVLTQLHPLYMCVGEGGGTRMSREISGTLT